MLPIDLHAVRIFLHVLAATVWVGGQLTLAGLLPALRAAGSDVPRTAARRFNRIAWPAYGVLVLTGVWNVVAEPEATTGRYATTLGVKVAVVALSGIAAYLHTRARTRRAVAVWGASSAIAALAALLLGVVLGTNE